MSVKFFASPIVRRLRERFRRLYGEGGDRCLDRLAMMVGRYGVGTDPEPPALVWDQRDSILITYGDMIRSFREKPLVTLRRFLRKRLRGAFNTVHILPFFPYSSDDGFAVVDYREVNPELGTWEDVKAIAKDFHLMVDLVLNHVSSRGAWFQDYLNGIAPYRAFFREVDPEADLSAVVRPRALPLTRAVQTPYGEKLVWTTFSEDQIDLDFRNPDVLFEFLDILFFYISKGARIIRLDAIAYLWKKEGTSCIHLPETHEVVKLFRDVCELVAPHVIILTETNVPHAENVSYFGDGDEAHMVYQFTLPPLLLHALTHGHTRYLTQWAAGLGSPPQGCCFLNFTASHDGIGVRPLEGIVPPSEIDSLVEGIRRRGGLVSAKKNPDGTESPYELNITYFDALAEPGKKKSDLHVLRFLCSQTVAMGLLGVPAVYFHSLVATRNDYGGVKRTGRARSINRRKYDHAFLETTLQDKTSLASRVLREYTRLLRIRARRRAFHPMGTQKILDLGEEVFAFQRISPEGSETVVSVSNFTPHTVSVSLNGSVEGFGHIKEWRDCIRGRHYNGTRRRVALHPYQTVWLEPKGANGNAANGSP